MFALFGHPDESGGFLSSAADLPHEYPSRALAAAAETFGAILAFREATEADFSFREIERRWEEFEKAPLVEFVNLDEEDRYEWLRLRGVFVEPE